MTQKTREKSAQKKTGTKAKTRTKRPTSPSPEEGLSKADEE